MKICPKCGVQLDDNAKFCTACGALIEETPAPTATQPKDEFDHTAEFDPKDISDNKVIAMLTYLLGIIGVFIAIIAAKESRYAAFHVRQSLKFTVVEILLVICASILAFTFIVPLAAVIMLAVLFVIKIICFFQICSGKAKEPAIIRSLKFLK